MQEVREAIESKAFDSYVKSFYQQRGKVVPEILRADTIAENISS